MKKNKFVKLIEHILVALPLLYVGGVALYTMINENAKDSYYGANINTSQYVSLTSVDDINTNDMYSLYAPQSATYTGSGNVTFRVEHFTNYSTIPLHSEVSYILFYTNSNIMQIQFRDINNNLITTSNTGSYTFNFVFNVVSFSGSMTFDTFKSWIYKVDFNKYSFMDSSLPYAMSEFNKLGFNKIPFTSFFVNIFHNGETNVYIDFVNNYLNYMLFVECSYFVPMILYWFIHFGEDVVDRFTRKGDKL